MTEEFKIIRRGYASKLKEIEPYVTAIEKENAKLRTEIERRGYEFQKVSNENLLKIKDLTAKLARYEEALKKISEDTQRYESRGDDLAWYEPSEIAKIAQKALDGK